MAGVLGREPLHSRVESGGGDSNGASLPSHYAEMKRLLLNQREDRPTSKLKKSESGSASRAQAPPLSAGGAAGGGGG